MIDAGKAIAYLELDTSGFSRGIKTAQQAANDLGSKTLSASSKIKSLGGALTSVGKVASTVSAGILAAGTAAVKTFTGFDDAIRQVQATMGLTAQKNAAEIATLTNAAKEIGVTTSFSAGQAAEALNYLAAAGYDTTKAVAALPNVLTLAQAGGTSLGTAADLVTGSMTALGMTVGELSGFCDQLAVAASASNASVTDMGQAILTVGGTAKSLAGGVVELNTALGILADNGIKGAEGGTAIRNIILSLSAPTDQAAKRMKKLGLDVYDAQGNMRGLNEIFGDLDKIMAGWTQKQRTDLFSTLFNNRDLKSAEALIASYGARWNELSGEIAGADGAAQQMADTMEGGIGGSFRKLSASVQGLAVEFGENLAPTVSDAAEFVTGLVRSFTALPEATQSSIVNIAAWTAAAGPMLIIGGKLISTIGTLVGVLSGPAGLVVLGVAGVAALAMGFDALAKSADSVGKTVNSAFDRLDQDRVNEVSGKIQAAVKVEVTGGKASLQQQIDAQYQAIIDTLKTGGTVTAADAAAVNTNVNNLIDSAMAGVDITTNAKIADLQAQLDSGAIDASAYRAQCEQIIAEAQSAKDRLADVRTQSNATIQGLVGDAGATAEEAEKSLSKIADAAGQAVQSINGIGNMLTIGSLYDVIREKLTDRKADSQQQTDDLAGTIEAWLAEEKTKLEEAINGQIAALDINDANYTEQVNSIKTQGAAMMTELESVAAASTEWLIKNSGRATEAVKANMSTLDAIDRRAMEVSAKIEQARQAEKTLQEKNVERVKGGYVRDEDTIAQTVGTVHSDYKEQRAAVDARRQQAMDELNASDLNGDAYAAQAQAIADQYDAETQNLLAAYQQNLAALFAGIASAYPEYAGQVLEGYKKQDLAEQLQDTIDKLGTEGFDASQISDQVMQALLGNSSLQTPEQVESFLLGNPGELATHLANARDALLEQARQSLGGEDADFGELGTLLAGAIQAGMFDDLSLDMTDGETKLKAMIGDLGAGIAEMEVPVAPKIKVEPGEVDATGVDTAIEEAVRDAVNTPDAPTTVATDLTITPTVDASDVPAAVEQAVQDAADDQSVTVDVDVNLNANGGSSGAGMVADYASSISGGSGKAASAAGGVAKAAAKALDGQAGAARTAGANLGAGFVAGMASKMGAVISKAASLARAAINAINKEAEVSSPSKATTRSGAWVGAGFVAGMLSKIRETETASAKLGEAGLVGMQKATETMRTHMQGLQQMFEMAPAHIDRNLLNAYQASQLPAYAGAGMGGAQQGGSGQDLQAPSLTINFPNANMQSKRDGERVARTVSRYIDRRNFARGGRPALR